MQQKQMWSDKFASPLQIRMNFDCVSKKYLSWDVFIDNSIHLGLATTEAVNSAMYKINWGNFDGIDNKLESKLRSLHSRKINIRWCIKKRQAQP